MVKRCTFYKTIIPWFWLDFSYDPDAIDVIKEVAGYGNYRYQPEFKRWLVKEYFIVDVSDALERLGYLINGHETGLAKQDNPWTTIFRSLDDQLVDRLYKGLVKIMHPDVGGDGRQMQLINDAKSKRLE